MIFECFLLNAFSGNGWTWTAIRTSLFSIYSIWNYCWCWCHLIRSVSIVHEAIATEMPHELTLNFQVRITASRFLTFDASPRENEHERFSIWLKYRLAGQNDNIWSNEKAQNIKNTSVFATTLLLSHQHIYSVAKVSQSLRFGKCETKTHHKINLMCSRTSWRCLCTIFTAFGSVACKPSKKTKCAIIL